MSVYSRLALPMAAAACICASAVHADVTEVQQTVQKSQGHTITARRTTYISGKNIRIDTGPSSVIINGTKHTITMLNIASKAFVVTSYTPTTQNPGLIAVNVKGTGKRSTMLGHPVHLYTVTVTSSGNGPTTKATGSIWTADDFPHPDLSSIGLPALNGFGASNKLQGIPMQTILTAPNGARMTTTVVSLATTPIPASRFQVPAGYRNAAAAAPGMPTGAPPVAAH